MLIGLFRKILFSFHNDFKWKKENFDLVLQVGTTLILAYVSLGAHQTTHWARSLSSRPVSRWNFTPPPSYVHASFSDPLRAYFSPLRKGMGLHLSTTMLQTPTSLSGEIRERPSHNIDFDLPYDRLPGGLISCSVAFGSAAIQVNWTLVTRHCLPKTMCNCTTLKGPGVEDQESGGLGCGAAVCGID